MKKITIIANALLFIVLTILFIYSISLPDSSSKKTFFIVLASILSIFYSMLLFFTSSFFIIIKLKAYDHMERWIRDLRRIELSSNLRLYDVMKKEIKEMDNKEIDIEISSTFFLFMKEQKIKKMKYFNKKIVLNSILNFEESLKNGFKINKNETLKQRLRKNKIRLNQEEFNAFVLYFLFEYFTKYGNYIENNTLYTKYCNKLI